MQRGTFQNSEVLNIVKADGKYKYLKNKNNTGIYIPQVADKAVLICLFTFNHTFFKYS